MVVKWWNCSQCIKSIFIGNNNSHESWIAGLRGEFFPSSVSQWHWRTGLSVRATWKKSLCNLGKVELLFGLRVISKQPSSASTRPPALPEPVPTSRGLSAFWTNTKQSETEKGQIEKFSAVLLSKSSSGRGLNSILVMVFDQFLSKMQCSVNVWLK